MAVTFPSAVEALQDLLFDGMTLAVGGFWLSGIPTGLIGAVRASGLHHHSVMTCDTGVGRIGLCGIIEKCQHRHVIASDDGENKPNAEKSLAGELRVGFNPPGPLAQRFRAGGAA